MKTPYEYYGDLLVDSLKDYLGDNGVLSSEVYIKIYEMCSGPNLATPDEVIKFSNYLMKELNFDLGDTNNFGLSASTILAELYQVAEFFNKDKDAEGVAPAEEKQEYNQIRKDLTMRFLREHGRAEPLPEPKTKKSRRK